MHKPLRLVFGTLLIASFSIAGGARNMAREKLFAFQAAAADAYKPSQEDLDKKNPVKPTPEALSSAKKLFGYDCSMCHGAKGDGSGDLAESMKLKMNNWGEPASLANMTDGEIFYIITIGKGKMTGEGDRLPATTRWNLVNLVRSLAKKGTPDAPAADPAKP
jgi:mono/diheme cytochrome c family protein